MNNPKLQQEEVVGSMVIPDRYRENDSEENKVIYALSQLSEGSAEDVGIKIFELDTSIEPGGFSHIAKAILKGLCEKGLIHCRTKDDQLNYFFIHKNND